MHWNPLHNPILSNLSDRAYRSYESYSSPRLRQAAPFLLAFALACLAACGADLSAGNTKTTASGNGKEAPVNGMPPVEMTDFVIYVYATDENFLREEVHAASAWLYQTESIARLSEIHVDFHKPDGSPKDTLDAPEGYLYLKDMELSTEDPFFERIGGRDTITTPTFEHPGEVTIVRRGQKDIDLLGRPGNKVLFRRPDGTLVSCLRAYRHTDAARLYGVGDCEMRMPQPKRNIMVVQTGDRVTVDDQLTSGINLKGKANSKPQIKFLPLKSVNGDSSKPQIDRRPVRPPEGGRRLPQRKE